MVAEAEIKIWAHLETGGTASGGSINTNGDNGTMGSACDGAAGGNSS